MPAFGAEQAALADRDLLRAAARQRAHDRGAATDVAAVADDHARPRSGPRPSTAERAGVEVAEALVHHRGAGGEVGAEAHAVGVGDAHAGRHDVVGHPRELVEAVHRQEPPAAAHRASAPRRRWSTATGPRLVHATLVSSPKRSSRLIVRGGAQPVRQQVQPKVHIGRPMQAARRGRSSMRDRDGRRRRAHRRGRSRTRAAASVCRRAPSHLAEAELADTTRRARRRRRSTVASPRPTPCRHVIYITSGRSVGKRMTSLIESTPASSIATRSIPMPSPPVGGMPYSRARR